MSVRVDGKEAESFIKLEESFDNYSLLDVSIASGRTHQIRVHLASVKLPIIGDKTYNPSGHVAKKTSSELTDFIRNFPRQALHSASLSFYDPDSDDYVYFKADMHDDMKSLLAKLKKQI